MIGTVLTVRGDLLEVEVDEVLSAGLHAKQYPHMCPSLRAGYRFEVTNRTMRFTNDLADGDRALFVGQTCDEYREGEMWLVPNAPNARRVNDDGTIDLGGGDIVTLDEARELAGRSFAPVPVAPDQLTVTTTFEGTTLRVDTAGATAARLGVALCDPGLVTLTSPAQDYFGRCSLQSVDQSGELVPTQLVDGRLSATFRVPSERRVPFDVIVFGEDATGLFQVRGIARVG